MTHSNGFMKDHKKFSSKGGKKTGVLKGFAWVKANDPEKFRAIIEKREQKRVRKD